MQNLLQPDAVVALLGTSDSYHDMCFLFHTLSDGSLAVSSSRRALDIGVAVNSRVPLAEYAGLIVNPRRKSSIRRSLYETAWSRWSLIAVPWFHVR